MFNVILFLYPYQFTLKMDDNKKQVTNVTINNDDDQDELAVLDDSIVSLDDLDKEPELSYADTYDEANIGFEELEEDDHDEIEVDLDDEEGIADFTFDDDDVL